MATSRKTYQEEIIKRTEAALCGLIDESHAECLPEVTEYMEILKEYMQATEDGMMRYYEGKTYSTVMMDYNSDIKSIWNFLNEYAGKTHILFVENHSGYIQISYYWTADIKKSGNIRVSIRRNSTGIIQDTPKHTLSFDERIITSHANGFKEIFEEFAEAKNEWNATVKARRVKAEEKRKEAIAEFERKKNEAIIQKIRDDQARQEKRLLHAVEKRARRCGVDLPDFEIKIHLTVASVEKFYEALKRLRQAKTNSSELNSRLQVIKALFEYTWFVWKPLYVEELEDLFGMKFDEIISE